MLAICLMLSGTLYAQNYAGWCPLKGLSATQVSQYWLLQWQYSCVYVWLPEALLCTTTVRILSIRLQIILQGPVINLLIGRQVLNVIGIAKLIVCYHQQLATGSDG